MPFQKSDSGITAGGPVTPSGGVLPKGHGAAAEDKRRRARTLAKQQQAAERISSASMQMSAGLNEAGGAVSQLKATMETISSTATEASGAAQESLVAITIIRDHLEMGDRTARNSRARTEQLRGLLEGATTEINHIIENVALASERQQGAVTRMGALETQASRISDAVAAVIRIADQTNLLALNAAIEAARAGKHGKGFAVIADTVRTLAEAAEKNAAGIEELITRIQDNTKSIAGSVKGAAESAAEEVAKGRRVNEQLGAIRSDMRGLLEGAEAISKAAAEMGVAGAQARQAGEAIAAAADDQAVLSQESVSSLKEQESALNSSAQAAQELDELSEELRSSTGIAKNAESVAAAAEELSAAVAEVGRSSEMISNAISEILAGATRQSSASAEAAAGIAQLEGGVKVAQDSAESTLEKAGEIAALLDDNKQSVNSIIEGIEASVATAKDNLEAMSELESVSRQIDKIVDAISKVSIQTSMLAVSGAVEAARAGEFGKGFAVVSSDIQNLSNDAAENVEQIKDLVKGIRDQIQALRGDIQSISVSVREEIARARSTSENLNLIEQDMDEVLAGNQQIKDAAIDIASASAQARVGVHQIAEGAKVTRASSEEASAAAKQQSDAMSELSASIEEISSTADELQAAG